MSTPVGKFHDRMNGTELHLIQVKGNNGALDMQDEGIGNHVLQAGPMILVWDASH